MQVMNARQAAELVAPGNTVAISGVVSLTAPEAVVKALGERFLETGTPKGLTVICPCRTGWSANGRAAFWTSRTEPKRSCCAAV